MDGKIDEKSTYSSNKSIEKKNAIKITNDLEIFQFSLDRY